MDSVDTGAGAGDIERIRTLSSTVREIVDGLPGRVQRVTVRAGELSVDLSFHTPEGGTSAAAAPAAAAPAVPAAAAAEAGDGTAGEAVRAPLVGTFYGRPSPDEPPFVEVGDVVEEGQQVALIEAMKLFNAVTAAVRGRIAKVHVADGDMVEYDQPLFDLVPEG
ncbi:acetyl-CoA carboxylase, biotin carboxyl carrier protein [Actinomadura nitritigenes]|uniref:Biotin carboxyl carrier protein of acetyl-CoA carboxylase n=2 Tax=Actinomadura nitritigenes TaxID=134602 RepID=A0ABS3QVW7_9ACTN|nr:biotin/lipoyl-containing protein [Actinomadura nitritigenes]MBO2437588.1 acetyl-CoA carboxylase, biotin carboxyl carrier protein [Actinomadura nitritigenes]